MHCACTVVRWCGRVIRMDDTLIPKHVFYGQLHHGSWRPGGQYKRYKDCLQVFYGQLHHGSWRPGGQYKRYKDCLKSTLNCCGIAPSELEAVVMDRADWRSSCKSAVEKFKTRRIQELESKQDLHKSGPPSTSNLECQIYHRMCHSWIRLLAHNSP